jgi:hypothetical protein
MSKFCVAQQSRYQPPKSELDLTKKYAPMGLSIVRWISRVTTELLPTLQKLPCPKNQPVLTERKPSDLLPAIKSLIPMNMEQEGEGIKENRYRDKTVLRVGPRSKTSKI